MLIGEAPGADEEREGQPFIGRAGQLLNQCIEEAGLSRDLVYVTNIVKCRPPNNRKPTIDEMAACSVYLEQELEEIKPCAILLLGNTPLSVWTGRLGGITIVRGTWLSRKPDVMATLHPSYVLRNPREKDKLVKDLRAFFVRAQEILTEN